MSAHPELVTCPACGPQPQFQGSLWCGTKGNEEGGGRGVGKEARPRPLPTPRVPGLWMSTSAVRNSCSAVTPPRATQAA